MEKVGLSQRKERRRKSRTKNWFLFFSVHGQADRKSNPFRYSVPSCFKVHIADWLVNEVPQGGEPIYFMLINDDEEPPKIYRYLELARLFGFD